jgi:hypothetical protein
MRSSSLVMSDSRVVIGLQATTNTVAAETDDATGFLRPGRRWRICYWMFGSASRRCRPQKIERHTWPPAQSLATPLWGTARHFRPSPDAEWYSLTCWEARALVLWQFWIDKIDAIAEGHVDLHKEGKFGS